MSNGSIIIYTLSDFAPVCRVTVSVERIIQLCHGFDRHMTSKKAMVSQVPGRYGS